MLRFKQQIALGVLLLSILGLTGCASSKSQKEKNTNRLNDSEMQQLAETFKNHKQITIERKGTIEINKDITIAGKGKNNVSRDPGIVNTVIYKHKGAIEHCYRKELKNYPKLKGKMLITITILPEGTVKNCKILYSSVRNHKVESCVLKNVRSWRDFPPIDKKYGPVDVDFKYLFY